MPDDGGIRIPIKLPTLHTGQVAAWQQRQRRNRIRCGRRWGKTKMIATLAGDGFIKGDPIGIFTPEHKQWTEIYDALVDLLRPLIANKSKSDGIIRGKYKVKGTIPVLDFWATNDNELAGRGREYKRVLIDEAAFGKNKGVTGGVGLAEVWQKSIEPTLLIHQGDAWAFGTPKGIDSDNFFYSCDKRPELGLFKDFHAPTSSSPFVPIEELERLRKLNDPLVFRQEYEAEFVDWSGVQFFQISKMLRPDGTPFPWPQRCDGVYAVIDTAVKSGQEHDGTAVKYFALSRHGGVPLLILDWDVIQIEGAMLETWLPTVFQNLSDMAVRCGARMGSMGAFIEDKASGTILIQQADKRGWPVTALDMKLTELGKDERAISVSGYVYQGRVGYTDVAYNKVTSYKGDTKNHSVSQVTTFRIGDKNSKRADDLTDTFTYGIAVGLGDAEGY